MREITLPTDFTARTADLRRAENDRLSARHADAIDLLNRRLDLLEQRQAELRELIGAVYREARRG